MDEHRGQDEHVAELMAIGLTRAQAERELAARAGENLSDISGAVSQPSV